MMRGFTLLETLTTTALVLVVAAVALPITDRMRQEGEVRAAAFGISSRCARTRMAAVHRAARVGMRFTASGSSWTVQSYVDGDWDGVRAADIASGRDPAIDQAVPIAAWLGKASFGFVTGCPLIDGSPPDGNALRIGSARMLVFSPDGSVSGGTFYLRGGTQASAYAVVVLAATGRTRVLRCRPGGQGWVGDDR